MSDEANPSGKAHRVVEAGIEKLHVAKNVVIDPVPTQFKIATVKIVKRFIFLSNFSYPAITLTFARRYLC